MCTFPEWRLWPPVPLGKLREEGLVEVRGRHVRIPSVEALLGRFNDSPVQAVTLR